MTRTNRDCISICPAIMACITTLQGLLSMSIPTLSFLFQPFPFLSSFITHLFSPP